MTLWVWQQDGGWRRIADLAAACPADLSPAEARQVTEAIRTHPAVKLRAADGRLVCHWGDDWPEEGGSTMIRWYRLQGEELVPCSREEWGEWFQHKPQERVVASTEIAPGIRVSTVALGFDHSDNPDRPELFETMVFGPSALDGEMWRWSTYQEAKEGHERIVEQVRAEVEARDTASGNPAGTTGATEEEPRPVA